MKRTHLLGLAGVALVAAASSMLMAAGIFPGFPLVGSATYLYPTGNELIPADTGLPNGINPQTVLMTPSVIAGSTWNTPRNLLGNGALNLTNTNGTSAVTCAINAQPTTAALSADRWACQDNVSSGSTANTTIVTATPSPPAGFTNVMKVNRATGTGLQPICVWSVVPSPQSIALAGQTVTFSAYMAALASLVADNGGVANLVIIAGSGTDQGLAIAPTASPAITPAWTNITTVVNTPVTLTTTFARFSTTVLIPATVGAAVATSEVGVGLCFTPTANTVGVTAATDGFAWTGAQLEKASSASLFEFRSKATETIEAQQYFYKISETAAIAMRGMCAVTTTSIAKCQVVFPTTMYKTPTMTYTAGFAACTQIACTSVTSCTSLATDAVVTALTPNNVLVACGSAAGFIVGAAVFTDNSGAGVINAWTGL